MNKKVEIGMLAAGGLGLFGLCFLGFAAVSNTPMDELAVVGPLFGDGEDEEGDEELASTSETLDENGEPKALSLPVRRTNAQDIVTANLGVLGAFALPSPFARADIETLVEDLRRERDVVAERAEALTKREEKVEEQLAILDAKAAEIERIKAEVETQHAALELRSLELKRDEDVEDAGEDLRYANLATLYASGDADQVVNDLVAMGPEEAARVLRILNEKRALDLLRSMTGENRREFIDAWARLTP